ncbi:MAG: SDR family oxidoreductase [Verrucomicrobia bacterium]|nr:SDR family oxidoreductase [Verrucomicrobiota bacterium]
MPRLLIAGCGYVGSAAARLFLHDGWQVTAWSRSGKIHDGNEPPGSLSVRAVNLGDPDDVQRNSFPCDVVVHCASTSGGSADEYRRVYRDGVRNLLAAFPAARVIFTSSTSVYGQRDGSWVDENSPAEAASEKAKILREAEELILRHAGIVLRLGGIHGPGRSFLLQAVLSGRISAGRDRYVNGIHRDDAAAAIHLVITKPPSRNGIFNVVDDTPALRSEIVAFLAKQLRRPLPQPAPRSSPRDDSNKRVSNAKLRALGWVPRYPSYTEGFCQSVLVTPA